MLFESELNHAYKYHLDVSNVGLLGIKSTDVQIVVVIKFLYVVQKFRLEILITLTAYKFA